MERALGALILNGMTSHRAHAYRRVTKTLRDMGPAKLWPAEQATIRNAADALVFATDLSSEEARMALAAVVVLTDELIDAQRWTPSRAQQLLDDIWFCGPGKAFGLPIAA
jgi:hypothetical protein